MVNIGQVRRHSFSNYLAETGNGTSIDHQERQDANNNIYTDTVIKCGALDSAKTYYLKARLEKNYEDPFQKINIRLRYSNDISGSGDNVYQNLRTVTLDTYSTSQQVEIMFTPNANYNLISFEIVRTADDSMPNELGTIGRVVKINKDINFKEVVNLIPSIADIYDGLVTLKQIGVRSEPGLRMCINGEEIFVGPSGVYEIYNGMQIKYLGFVINDSEITSDKKSDFIVDFTY